MNVGSSLGVRPAVRAWLEGRAFAGWPSLRSALGEETERAHALAWWALALICGAATWFMLPSAPPVAALLVALFLVIAVWGWLSRRRVAAFLVLVACFLAGMIVADVETRRLGTMLLDGPVTTRVFGRVMARDRDHQGRWRYTIDLVGTAEPEIRRPPTRVRLVAAARHDPIGVGTGIAGRARLSPPSGPALPGGFDFAFHAFFRGLGAHGYFLGRPDADFLLESDGADSFKKQFAVNVSRLRGTIADRIRAALPGEAGSLAVALTVADRRGVDPEVIETLRVSGLAHILAISGLHMALVAGTSFWFLRSLFCLFPGMVQRLPVKKYAAVGALAIATAYLLISGASVSTRRAYIMLVIMLVAILFDRRALTLRNVAIAAIIIVAWTPSAVLGPGFQMSFAATAMLIAVFGLWERYRFRAVHDVDRPTRQWALGAALFLLGLALTSLVAGLATAPFAIFHFNRVAAFGLLANLLAMPIVTFVVMPAGLAAMLAMPFSWERGPLLVMGEGLDAVMAIARFVEDLGGAIVVPQIGPALFGVMVAGLTVFVFARSGLRWTGALALAGALAAMGLVPAQKQPAMLISEDGRLVGLVGKDQVATNRRRPPGFVFEQWQRSLGGVTHFAPIMLAAPEAGDDGRQILRQAFADRSDDARAFTCIGKQVCLAVTSGGRRIVTVEDLAYLGAACDVADLVIVSKPIQMTRCYSGATLVTARMLRQSGALAFRFESGQLQIQPSIETTRRRWTRHRIYDWRSRSYTPLAIRWMDKVQ